MAITNIAVNFTPCVPGPIDGYNIEYRVVGDALYIDAGNFMSSPANISVSYPDGTQFEGIVHSPCGDVIWSTVTVTLSCGCRFAYPGEDEFGAETRLFDSGGESFTILNTADILLQTANLGLGSYFLKFHPIGDDNIPFVIQGTDSTNGAFIALENQGFPFPMAVRMASSKATFKTEVNIFPEVIQFDNYPASNTGIETIAGFTRGIFDGSPSTNGVGLEIYLQSKTDDGTNNAGNKIVSRLTDVTTGAATSEFSIKGQLANAESTLFVLSGNGQATLNKYGIGTFADDPVYGLGVLADGTIVEYDPGAGGGGSGIDMMRFGYSGEDDTAGEDRVFNVGELYQVRIEGGYGADVQDSIFKVVNSGDLGTAVFIQATGAGAYALIAQGTDVGAYLTGTNAAGASISSTNGLGAYIYSQNNLGAQISTDSGYYSTKLITSTLSDNDQVHPNLLLNAFSTNIPVADGFGQSIDFETNTTDFPTVRLTHRITSKWTTADDAIGVSELSIQGVDAGALQNLFVLSGNGQLQLAKYGIGTFDDTPVRLLGVLADGTIIEVTP